MARTVRYYPVRGADQVVWLRNFRNKLPNYKTALGYTDPEVAAAQADCDRLAWLIETFQGSAQSFAQAVTAHVRLVQTGSGTAPVDPPAFTLPSTPAPPANVTPGSLRRLFNFIKNLKTRGAYTVPMGEDLGVIGAEVEQPDPATTKPDIKVLVVTGGKVGVQWKKLGFTGVRIEVDRGGGWTFLAVDTEPHYLDTASPPAGTAVVWKYRAIYLDGDDPFGQWSDTVQIAVTV